MCIGSDREGRAGVSDGISYVENVSPSLGSFCLDAPLCNSCVRAPRRAGGEEKGDGVNSPKVCLARPCASNVLSAVMRAESNGSHSPAVSSVCVWTRSDCVPIGDDFTL